MFDLVLERSIKATAREKISQAHHLWVLWLSVILAVTALIGGIMLRSGVSPSWIAWLIYLIGAAAIFFRPRYALYLALFFSLAGDTTLTPWLAFTKGFSSRESLLFLSDRLILSPLESYILFALIAWFARAVVQRKLQFRGGTLVWPALIFLAFTIFGLIYGIGTGGNMNIALWEARPLFYMVAMLILTSNQLEKREHVSHLVWAAMLALFIKSIFGVFYYFVVLKGDLTGIESITEHSAAVQLNTVFILTLAAWLYKTPRSLRSLLLVILPFCAITYIAAQRRAAFISLAIALLLLFAVLYIDNRKAFLWITPPAIIIAVMYLALFWNSTGAIGLPAQAVKTVIAPGQATAKDQSSDIYRIIENVNTGFTIHQKPLTGVGFGQKFYVIVPMADISFFSWWQYLPHNSIIWIWLKTGVGGFCAMLFLVGSAILTGTRVFRRMPKNQLRAFALTATLYLVMHFVYAYVDISWDGASMVYIGAMMGLINSLERVAAQPVTVPGKRFPWQPDPQPEQGIIQGDR